MGDSLVNIRNDLDHGDWTLQGAVVADTAGRVAVTEPGIGGMPVTKWVADMTDRIICFVEDVIAHGIQQRLAHGITLAEIPVAQRVPRCPFDSGTPSPAVVFRRGKSAYHASHFDET